MGHYVDEGVCDKHGEWYAKHAHCPDCDDDLTAALRKAEAEVARLDALNRELAVDLKEWRIRFPVTDPTIARRMVEDRARAEADAALATERAARESAEQKRDELLKTVGWLEDEVLMRDRMLRDRANAIRDAEQLAVWVARKGVMVGHDECVRPCVWFDVHRGVEYDGTDAGIRAALRQAMDEG